MKLMKSLLLGSPAVLIALGGAQAADLPVKAKAVEYVRICSLFGAGFYYIPGTDTCIKLGGYLRAETALNSGGHYNGQFSSINGAHNGLSNYYTTRSRADLNIDTRTATEYGVVRTYFDAVFTWTSGNYTANGATPAGTAYSGAAPVGNPSDGGTSGGSLGVYFAFIQFAGFTMGKTISQFDAPWTQYPGNNFDGLVGGGGTSTGVNQFTYTFNFGQGVSAALSAQDPAAYGQTNIWNATGATASGIIGGAYGSNNIGGSRSPDLIGMVRVDQAWGLFQLSVAAHDNLAGYYGATETTGSPTDKWGYAVQGALSIKNIPTGAGDVLNIQGVYTNGASRYNFQSLANTTYSMFSGSGLAGAYQSVGFAGVSDAVYGGTTAAAGTGLELTTTYGLRGAYTHSWDAHWNTGLYGAYGAVRYSSTAKGLICGSAGMAALALTGTCNPDFDIAQVGVITRWVPVKNLTFSGDFNWTRIDQKHSGTVTVPATLAGVAKPAAVYELKDQDSFTLLLRAQRNW